ncbi:MAG: hypothetical protein ACP5SF_05565 [Thermoplasmata archaeon]
MDISITLSLFGQVILVIFALILLIFGIFTAYFGSGKSRIAGISLLLIGLIIGIIYVWLSHASDPGYFVNVILVPGLAYIGGAIIGAVIGFLIFILVIMKT